MNTIQVDDVADIGRLLGADGELLEMNSEFSPFISVAAQRALRVRKGLAVVQNGVLFPVLEGRTCTSAFLEAPPTPGGTVLAASSVPRARLKDVILLAGSTTPLPFLFYYFPALLFAKHVAGPAVTVHSAHALPAAMAPVIGDLLPILAGGRPASVIPLGDGTYGVEDCIFPIVRTKSFLPAVSARRIILPFVLSRADAAQAAAERDPVKLFLRETQHPLVNEDEVAAWFVRRGYLAVDVATLSFAEQVMLFRRATHIVGRENSPLSNLVFAVQAQTIIILRRDNTALDPLLGYLVEDLDATMRFVDTDAGTASVERLEKLDSAAV